MKYRKRFFALLLAVLMTGMIAMPAFAAADTDTVYPEEFYWDKAGEDADNGYMAFDVAFGKALLIPPDPEREGHVFLGWKDWYTDEIVDLSQQTMDAFGRRFYAAWERTVYYVRFYVDGELWITVANTCGEAFIHPRLPEKEGYTFSAWSPKPPQTMPAEDLEFSAVFTPNTYYARFYVDGTLWTTVENTFGEAFIHPRLPEKEGYTFSTWSPKLPAVTPAEDTRFDAVFSPETYIATLLVDGEVYKQIPYTYGQKSINLPDVPEKAGYTGAWEGYSLVIGGVTIHAVYTPETYIATLLVDGEVYKQIPYTYGQKSIDLPEIPKKTGYSAQWESYTLPIGGTTIRAVYTPTDYRVRCMAGDAGGDGMVTLKDVTVLQRYLAGGWDVRVHEPNGDVNGDGTVDLRDVALLRRYLAGGWDVELV